MFGIEASAEREFATHLTMDRSSIKPYGRVTLDLTCSAADCSAFCRSTMGNLCTSQSQKHVVGPVSQPVSPTEALSAAVLEADPRRPAADVDAEALSGAEQASETAPKDILELPEKVDVLLELLPDSPPVGYKAKRRGSVRAAV